jgi:hypothetical protein
MDRGDKITAWIMTVFAVTLWSLMVVRFWGEWAALVGGTCFVYAYLRIEVWKKR